MKDSILIVKSILRRACVTEPVTDKKIISAYKITDRPDVSLAAALSLLKVGAFVNYQMIENERTVNKKHRDYYNPFDSLDKGGF